MAVSENIVTNTITTEDLENARVREIDFVEQFSDSIKKLTEALGVTRKIAKQAGTVLKTYKASGTLVSGAVNEGDVIPLSKYTVTPKPYKELTLKKWRKATTAEAIVDYGFDQAVGMTTEAMLRDVQKGIRKDFFDFLKSPTGKTTASGVGVQGALAAAWGKLQVLFEDTEIETVYFMHPEDVAAYLASANISMQTAFGMSYVENFLGLGTVILNSSVEPGKVYATAKNNIVMYYIAVNGADLGNAFSFTADATGYVGIHETPDYSNLTCSDTVVSGIELFAERTDGVVIASISHAPAADDADET